MAFDWNEQQNADLRQWWLLDGLSASQISKKLTDKYKTPVTRNAVIGKATRLGIAGENRIGQPAKAAYQAGGRMNARTREAAKPARVPPPPKPRPASQQVSLAPAAVAAVSSPTAPKNVAPVAPLPEPAPELVVVGQAVILADLKACCCKYPVGPTPPIGDMDLQLFCAAETGDPIRPYCDKHERIAWKSATAADRAKRLQNDIKAAHRDMVSRNTRRHANATRAVF